MAFERKEVSNKSVTNSYWQIFQWFMIIVPALYFIFIMPSIFQQGSNEPVAYSSVVALFLNVFNMGVGAVLFMTHPLERSRDGAANIIVKMAIVQQLVSQSFFGFGLGLIAWYKLPTVVSSNSLNQHEKEQKSLSPKALYIIMGLLLILTGLVVLSNYIVN